MPWGYYTASGQLKQSTSYVLPAARGFRATLSANQNINASTTAKVQLNTETYDTHGWYDNATNYRFTPLQAGYYIVTFSAHGQSGDRWMNGIYKNGAAVAQSYNDIGANNGNAYVTDVVQMNGTTDYIEFFVSHDDVATHIIAAGPLTYGSAFFLGT